MDDGDFLKFVNDSIDSLPNEFKKRLKNLDIVIDDFPSKYQIEKLYGRGERGYLLGLYEGIPQTKRRNYGVGGPLPDKITIFKIPLLQISRDPDHLKENVKKTVIHEIGHHFGMSEEDIRKASIRNRESGN